MHVQGKVALVMGGGSGIGRASALALARHGASVVVGDLVAKRAEDVVREIIENGFTALGSEVDVTQLQQVSDLVEKTIESFGQIDLLINSAGIFPQAMVQDLEEEEWDKVMAVNLKGTFLTCREVVGHMITNQSGRIINISAGHGGRGVVKGAHYAASKAGVNSLTKTLALEVAEHGILVNAIAPGPVDTPLPRGGRLYTEEEKQKMGEQLPLGRIGRVEDLASMVLFLASDDCKWFTGQIVYHNGGDLMLG
ncbi:MAG: SDR family NAD(P)-dependent oxidoreductase [Acidobacteriota bacterium]|nr:SDR family NAD(P)-dependent oxidoreductase [Acidobacteriota bacterium]